MSEYILSDKNSHIKIFNAAGCHVFKVFKRKLVCCYIYNSRKHLHLASKLAFQGKQKQESMKQKTSLFIYQDIVFVNESKFDQTHPAGDVLCWLCRAKNR